MFKKLNVKGVSHHFLLPIMAVLVIAGIGGYVMQRSSSAMTDTGSTTTMKVKKTVYATKNGAGKTCKQRTYMLNAKSTCVTYAQQAMGITADGVFGKNTQKALKSKTDSTTLNSASWSTLCSKIKSKKPALYGKAGCSGKSYTYYTTVKKTNKGPSYPYCVKYTYKAPSKNSAGVPKSEPKVSCTKNNFSTKAAGEKARATARTKTAYQNYQKDLNKYKAAKAKTGSTTICVKYTYKAPSKDSAGVPKSKPTVSCADDNTYPTVIAANKANVAAKSKTAYQNYQKDLRKYNDAQAKKKQASAPKKYENMDVCAWQKDAWRGHILACHHEYRLEVGSARYNALWHDNDDAWNACRDYFGRTASTEQICKDKVVF